MSVPTGRPNAIREILILKGLISFDKYIAVASPSISESVAIITSFTSSEPNLLSNSFIVSCSGPIPSRGDIAP